ncbi:MAG: ABC transporter ATP-binding protein [candidate division WOR-3 bacterium]
MNRKLLLKLKKIVKKFENFTLGPFDLELREGEIYGLIGPNGSGKTTTLKIITGLLIPDEGEIYFKDKKITDRFDSFKRYIGYIPDNPFVYPYLSGYEHLLYTGKLYKLDDKFIKERIDFYSKLFEMRDYIDTQSRFYSHGMRQKISITSALIHNPDLIIIDEPLVALDPVSAFRFKKHLKELKEKGKSILLATHSLFFAEEMCDRVGIIFKGKIFKEDTPSNIKKETESENLEEAFIKIVG